MDDVLRNASRYTLAAGLGRGRQLQANDLQRVSGTPAERVAGYVDVLRETEANLLLTGPGVGVLAAPGDRTPDVEQAARATGFAVVGRTRTPDGRPLTTWWRDRQPSTLCVTDRAERRR